MTEQVLCQCGCGGYVDIGEAYIEGHLEAAVKDKHFLYDNNNDRRMRKNRDCTLWLGCYVAETLLYKVFKNVERMPMHNPGYDFVCNKGWKIDAKSSCLHKNGGWSFTIKRNTKADYFFCVAYDNRKDLNIIHIWLLPGEKFNHRSGVSISPSALDKWDKYEQPLDKVIKCCDSMKAQATCEMRYSIDEIWDEADAYISIEASADEKSL